MMKILLINPDPNPYVPASNVDFSVPMSVLSVGTYLKKNGVDARIIDGRLYRGQEIFDCIDEYIHKTDLIGLSVMTAQIKEALRISQYIKGKYKDKKIVFGGVHPTLFPEQTLQCSLVDFIVIGEGEITALELTRAIDAGSDSDFSDIKGLGFKKNGQSVVNERRELMPMDDIPFQEFELLDIERYIMSYYPYIGIKRNLMVQTSRGCPHRCAFCINYLERNYNIWRAKSPNLVIEEIKELKKRYKIDAISFRDENLFVNKKHARGVIEGLSGLDIRWFANVRADYFNEEHLSGGLLKDARTSGAAYLGVGAESGSERILKLICKDITVEQIVYTARQMHKYDIVSSYSFVTGIPSETKEDMFQTVELMKKLKKISPKSIFSGPQILRPYPGGALYDLCIENGYNSPSSLYEWASQDTGKFGELSLKNYRWIRNQSLVTALSTYVPAALNYDFMMEMDLKRKIYASLARIRLSLNFWSFPYEYQLAMKALKYINLLKGMLIKLFPKKRMGIVFVEKTGVDIKTLNVQKISLYSKESVVEDHAKAFFRANAMEREEGFIKAILQNLPSRSRGKLLDLGCGIGSYAHFFKNSGLDVVAIDFSAPMCLFAKNKLNIMCCVSNVEAIPFKSGVFDIVSAIGLTILEQIGYPWEYKERIIDEIRRVVKDDSFLVLGITNKDSLINKISSKSKTILDTEILVQWLKDRNINCNSQLIYGLPVRLMGLFSKSAFLKNLLIKMSGNKYIGMRRVLIFKIHTNKK